jgi:hypothetical protein
VIGRHFDPGGWWVVAGGGYRRGNTEFHDADFLVSHPDLKFGSEAERAPPNAASLLELVLKDLSDHHTVDGGCKYTSSLPLMECIKLYINWCQ